MVLLRPIQPGRIFRSQEQPARRPLSDGRNMTTPRGDERHSVRFWRLVSSLLDEFR